MASPPSKAIIVHPCDTFFDLTVKAREVTSGYFIVGALALAAVVGLVVHCCHRRAAARARQLGNDAGRGDDLEAASMAQAAVLQARMAAQLKTDLAASQARTAELEHELAAEKRRGRGIFESGMQRIQLLERKLASVEAARHLQAEAETTSYAMYLEAAKQVEHLRRLLAEQATLGVQAASQAETSAQPGGPSAAVTIAPPGTPSEKGSSEPSAEAEASDSETPGEPSAVETNAPRAPSEPAAAKGAGAPPVGPTAAEANAPPGEEPPAAEANAPPGDESDYFSAS